MEHRAGAAAADRRSFDTGGRALHSEEVLWAVMMVMLAGVCVLGVVLTAASVQAADTERDYFRGSVRLWLLLAGVVSMLVGAIAPSVMRVTGVPEGAYLMTAVLVALPCVVAVVACLLNAWSLHRVYRRRDSVLGSSLGEIEAVVIDREHKPFAHDLLSITLEASVPAAPAEPAELGSYRKAAAETSATRRFVETCPGEQWARLAPGARVRLRVDLEQPRRYALVLGVS